MAATAWAPPVLATCVAPAVSRAYSTAARHRAVGLRRRAHDDLLDPGDDRRHDGHATRRRVARPPARHVAADRCGAVGRSRRTARRRARPTTRAGSGAPRGRAGARSARRALARSSSAACRARRARTPRRRRGSPVSDRSASSNFAASSISTSSPSTKTRWRISRTVSAVAGSISSFVGSSRPPRSRRSRSASIRTPRRRRMLGGLRRSDDGAAPRPQRSSRRRRPRHAATAKRHQ